MGSGLRGEVLAFVARYPGVHAREVERRMGLAERLASYHLDALTAEGLLERVDQGGYARFFPREATQRLDARDLAFIGLMRRTPALHIVLLLLSEGESGPSALAEDLALARPSVSYQLKALQEAGVVERVERKYRLRDRDYVTRMLALFHPLPGDLDEFSALWDDLVGR